LERGQKPLPQYCKSVLDQFQKYHQPLVFSEVNSVYMFFSYAPDSLEMMSRRLADVYFLFGHYAGSYQLYHQLKKDFFGDSAYAYFASSLEMAAVSHFMMSQVEPPLATARAFPVHYIGDAINHYVDNCR
jgi:hypothetical protein